jgi:glycosyltransferase involved in cell wall biosynthesis
MRLLFICPYPIGEAASQRFRFEQYFAYLTENKIEFDTKSFLSHNAWQVLYRPGHLLQKIFYILGGIFNRFALLFYLHKYDYIFIHREASPVGPAIFEFLIAKVFNKKIIYDFDDAIWIPNSSESNSFYSFLKFYKNTYYICKVAYKVSCGNMYLCNYAAQYNKNVVYNPTTIDTENYHNKIKEHNSSEIVIGWTGSHSTNRYLDEMVPVIKQLEDKYTFKFCVISDKNPELSLKSFEFIKWNKDTEIADLLRLDIGIMPLHDDMWASGKCGFKALQYMSLGIPALVSPVGVNTKIVDDGINGFICKSENDWYVNLENLISNRLLLQTLAINTRKKIEEHYSVKSNKENFIKLFQ